MLVTNADPRYAGRDDNTQGGDMVMTMEKITQMISYNVESNDNATWLWLTSEQMGFHLSTRGAEEGVRRAEGSDQSGSKSERRDCHPTASHLAPAIADFISDDKREGYDDELEQILTFLHDTWSKECESVNEKNRTQPRNQSSSRTRSSKTGRLSRGGTCGGKRHQYRRLLTTPNFCLNKC